MGYTAGSFTAGQQPTTAQWNVLWSNDASFNDGTGIANGAIKSTHLGLTGSQTSTVSTSQSRSNTSYGDLATVGPSVTVTVNSSGLALVIITCRATSDTSADYVKVSYSASGANTITAGDTKALILKNSTGAQDSQVSWTFLETSLAAGSTTFTLKYANSLGGTGTATYQNRTLTVIPL